MTSTSSLFMTSETSASTETIVNPLLFNYAIKLNYKEEGQEVNDTYRVQAPSSSLALIKVLKRLNNDLPKEVKIKIKQV